MPISFCEAIAREEGWLVPGSRCRVNCNPGNIEAGSVSLFHGAIGSDGRFAIFPNAEAGFKCMSSLLTAMYKGLTVEKAIARYAPPWENDTAQYVRNVCEWTELTPDTVLTPEMLEPPLLEK